MRVYSGGRHSHGLFHSSLRRIWYILKKTLVGARERESPACGDPYPIWQKAISMCMAVGVGRQRSRRPTMLQYFW